jgi:hypothetical protein
MALRVLPFAPLRVIESAYEILMGEIITFSLSPALCNTLLKISKENEFSDSIRVTWSCVRFIGTGSVGRLSLVLLHDIEISNMIRKTAAEDPIILVFIMVSFKELTQLTLIIQSK